MPNDHTASYEMAVAIVGMAGRFPDASTVDRFWENIVGGVCSIRTFSLEEVMLADANHLHARQPGYVRAGTVVQDIDRFDAAFFGYSPREAEILDPQHRLFLECAWEALEHSGCDPTSHGGPIGVFAGASFPWYIGNNVGLLLGTNPEIDQVLGRFQVELNANVDSLAARVSYKLNLRGPSVSLQTFCSTSLVAVHLACQSLLTYEADLALAGGVALTVPQGTGYLYQEGGILSRDGRCRSFDADAQGTVMGSGLGVVVLKRMEDALAQGDQIHAVILGSAINHDGVHKVGFTAPAMQGQSAVIASAMRRAGADPDSIGYVEAHGTGTALGDSVELSAMINAFRRATQRKQFCAIGAVKPNIGHLDRAAGVTGLIKATMALKTRQLPPSLDFDAASPDIDLDNSPFYVNTRLSDWPSPGRARRAGVSSFGLGGTNAHVVLEEAPEPVPSIPARPCQLLVLSAKTPSALERMTANLAAHLRHHPESNLADVAWTLQDGRAAFAHRRAVMCRSVADAIEALEHPSEPRVYTVHQTSRDVEVVFLLPDGGRLTATVFQQLSDSQPAFSDAVEHGQNAIDGLARLLESWGVRPRAVIEGPPQSGQRPEHVLLYLGRGDAPESVARQYRQALSVLPDGFADDQVVDALVDLVGRLWLAGVRIDWNRFHAGERRCKTSLPTYPFERHRYWIQGKPPRGDHPIYRGLRRPDVGDWFAVTSWMRTPSQDVVPEPGGSWLLLADARELGTRLGEWLRGHGQDVVLVRAGEAYSHDAAGQYRLRPGERSDYQRLLEDLRAQGKVPTEVVHGWLADSLTDDSAAAVDEVLELGFYSLLALTQALGDDSSNNCRISIVSTELQEVVAGERTYPAKAALIGACRVIPLEYLHLTCRSIDLGSWTDEERLIEQLGGELCGERQEAMVALHGSYRWVQRYEPLKVGTGGATKLRHGGVYLITGGLGGIGLGLAEYLAEEYSARLVLVGRSALSERPDRSAQVQALEARGSEVLVLQADVGDAAQMRSAVQQAVQRFGTIHGVIHAAGVPGIGLMQLKSAETARAVLRPKVQGTLALSAALAGLKLDFLVLFSSVTSANGGGPGQVDYCAANAFMDAWANQCPEQHGQTVSISWGEWLWDAWQEGLQGYPEEARAELIRNRQAYGLSFREGAEAICRALTTRLSHVFVTTRDLRAMVEEMKETAAPIQAQKFEEFRQSQPLYPRPLLTTPYVAPENETEQRIVVLWRSVLGIEQIGVDDNFFELGGNSLVGTILMSRMRQTFETRLPIALLFDAPTVRELALAVELAILEQVEQMDEEEARQLARLPLA